MTIDITIAASPMKIIHHIIKFPTETQTHTVQKRKRYIYGYARNSFDNHIFPPKIVYKNNYAQH